MMKSDKELVAKWIKKQNKTTCRLVESYVDSSGRNCYILAMRDRKREFKLVLVRDGMCIRYGLETLFACDDIDPIMGADDKPAGFKFYRPYMECSDEHAYALWCFGDEAKRDEMARFDFNTLRDLKH